MLRKLWRGEYPLRKAFWGFYVGVGLLSLFATGLLVFLSRLINARPVAFAVGLVALWTYATIASVGVWRSAGADVTSPFWVVRMWAIAARVVVLLLAARICWNLINGGAATLLGIITGHLEVDY